MKYFFLIIFFIFSCSETPNEVPVDSYRDICINIDMTSAVEDSLFNKNRDTLKLQLDESLIFEMINASHPNTTSNNYYCIINNLILGQTYSYQYIINENIEVIDQNRFFTIIDSENMISDFYGELNPTLVTFFVNMSYQIELGNFDIENDFLDVAGTFNNWGSNSNQLILIENNIYTFSITNIEIGDILEFKFRINGSWDSAEFPGYGANRTYTVLPGDNILEYWFNDEKGN
tara:strand:- start:688 stop:1383 length:696 start_codon:yes stop_codon:yes gene_type:complete